MNLKAYLANKNMTFKQFAEIVQCHPQYIANIGKGRYKPGKRLLTRILKATKGQDAFDFDCKAALQVDE